MSGVCKIADETQLRAKTLDLLEQNQASFYGAEWCGHCSAQKAKFNEGGENHLVQKQIFKDCGGKDKDSCPVDLEGYPTWEIRKDNQVFQKMGNLPMQMLCEFASDPANHADVKRSR